MADNTANPPVTPWLPAEIWGLIASFLDNDELAQFRQVCKLFNRIGSDAMMLQPLYNRLRAIDKTLPAELQTAATQAGKSPLIFLKETFEKIQAKQEQEIAYLTKHHPAIMAKPEYAQALRQNTSVSLKSLEAENAVLDAVNSEIVTTRIKNINRTHLNLDGAHITRLPVALFKAAGYANFWQNLIHLDCGNNQLTSLNLQELAALQSLDCEKNQLTELNLQGLVALQNLWCENNQLTALNLQGLGALQKLYCSNNQLTALNLQGVMALQTLLCSDNQLTELNLKGVVALQYLRCHNNQLTELNLQGLMTLRTLNCKNNQLTSLNLQGLAVIQSLDCENNKPLTNLNLSGVPMVIKNKYADLPAFSAYLPSASASNNAPNAQQKRTRDEEQIQDNNQMEQKEKEPGDEPDTKRRKAS